MRIEKECNVQELANKLRESVETVYVNKTRYVNIDIITAQEVVDVLETVASWENKGDKSNNKIDENGNILRTVDNYGKALNHFQKVNAVIPECFGTFRYNRNLSTCHECEYVKECCMKANSKNKAPVCFRCYDDKNSKCDNCEAKAGCAIATEENEKEELEDNKTCFGECVKDNYLCTHCREYEECSEETIHREELAYKEELDDFI